jgi:hypothetical protein
MQKRDTVATAIVLRVDYDDQSPEVLERMRGPEGKKGDRGEPGIGLQGEQGEQGPPGSVPPGSVVFWSMERDIPDGWHAAEVQFPEWWKGVWAPHRAPVAIVKV